MNITDVRVRKVAKEGKMKAVVSITIDDEFVVHDIKVIEGEKGFGCTNWKNGCKYTIWKNDKFIEAMGKKVTKEMVELLLKNGKVGFRNLKSKKGTLFSAYLRYEKDEETGYYNWKMEFIN